jgi:hypothetical protein
VQRNDKERIAVLLADREAPLGWVYLSIYDDNSFEFESRGLERQGDFFSGTIELKADTIIFNYKDSIPKAGTKAIIGNGRILFIDGAYPESVEIKLNEL